MRRIWLLIAVLAFGCGESKRDVIARFQPQGSQVRERLAKFAESLPPSGSVRQVVKAPPLQPAATYHEEGEGNVEIVMESQLRDPDSSPPFDLRLSRNLLTCLAWTGPKNPMVASALSSGAGDLEQQLQRGFDFAYLVVVRVHRFAPPEAVDDKTFRGGEAELEVLLYRAGDPSLLGSFPVRAQPADSISVSMKKSDDPAERMREFAKSSAWTDARRQVIDGLRNITGGDFKLRN